MRKQKLGTRRPLRTEPPVTARNRCGYTNHQERPDSRDRGRETAGNNHRENLSGNLPSDRFDWDTALYLHAHTMAELGYPLSREQRAMLRNG